MNMSQKQTNRSRDRTVTRSDVEDLIAQGRKIVIVDNNVLKVDAWLPYHPGGDKAILHMIGRDATNEVRAFHSSETQQQMLRYQIGRIEGPWQDFVPPVQGGTFRTIKEQEQARRVAVDAQIISDDDASSEQPSPLFEGLRRRGLALGHRVSPLRHHSIRSTSGKRQQPSPFREVKGRNEHTRRYSETLHNSRVSTQRPRQTSSTNIDNWTNGSKMQGCMIATIEPISKKLQDTLHLG